MKTVLIVEDDSRSREMLIKIVGEVQSDAMVITASSREEAGILAMEHTIDLFLLDIILDASKPGDVSGMNFAEYIRTMERYKYTPIIFTTALEDPALHAYSDLHCYYYVEKPYDVDKVSSVIGEALTLPHVRKEPKYALFRKDGILYRKALSDIIYIENIRSGQVVYCTNGNLSLPYKPCKVVLEELGSERFLQCSRYYVVNKEFIDKIDTASRQVLLKDGYGQIDLGETFRKKFLREMTENMHNFFGK